MERLNSEKFKPENYQESGHCEKHGEFVNHGFKYSIMKSISWGGCPQCKQERDEQVKREIAEKEKQDEIQRMNDLLGRSGLPRRFIGKTFDTFNAQTPEQMRAFNTSFEYAKEFEKNFEDGRGLIFIGKPGTGKSHLGAAIIQQIMPRYLGVYVTVSDLIRLVRGTWRRDSEYSEIEMLNNFIYADLLVLDEVGKQYGTDGEQQILFDVIDGRYREQKPTVLMGNVTGEEIAEFLGERNADRLRETNTAISFNWESYRKRAA